MAAPVRQAVPPSVEWAIRREMARTFGTVQPDVRDGRVSGWMIVCHAGGQRHRIRHVQLPGSERWVRLSSQDLAREVLESIRQEIRGGTPELAAIAPYLKTLAPQRRFRAAWERFVEAKVRQTRHGGRQLSRERLAELEGHLRRGHLAELEERALEPCTSDAAPRASPTRRPSGWSPAATRRVWLAACRRVFPEWEGQGGAPFPENQSLRHAYATHLVNRGVALSAVGAALGHVDPRTTHRYTELGVGAHAAVLRPVRRDGS